MPRGKAFAWIGNPLILLVAVAAVGWVWAYSMPRIREASKDRTCAANLKRLGEACTMYQADWHDVLVPYGAPFAWPPKGHMWPELLDPHIKKLPEFADMPGKRGRVFLCPGVPDDERCFCPERDYGINQQCGGWMPGEKPVVIRLKNVGYPRSTIRIADVCWKAQGGSFFAAKPSEFKPGDPMCHVFAARHEGKGNVLWIDGHVSAMTLEQYNMRDKGPYDGNIWLRLEGPKPPLP